MGWTRLRRAAGASPTGLHLVPKPSPPDSRVDVDTRAPRRWPWARLLQWVFGFEVPGVRSLRGRRRILGAVTEPHAMRRLLAALGLGPPLRATLRPP